MKFAGVWSSRIPPNRDFRNGLAFGYYRLGDLFFNQIRDLEKAAENWRAEAELREQIVMDNPDNARLRRFLGGNLNNVAMVLEQLDRVEDAAQFYSKAVKHQRAALKISPDSQQSRAFLSNHLDGLMRTLRKKGDLDASVAAARDLADLWPKNADWLYAAAIEVARWRRSVQILAEQRAALARLNSSSLSNTSITPSEC